MAFFHGYESIEAGRPVVVAVGELDMGTTPELEELLLGAEAGRPDVLIVDLREISFVDSTGLHLLVRALDRAKKLGRRLVLIEPPSEILRAFEVTGLRQRFEWATDPALVD
jgi:anti-sigma B factor antagonist